MDVVTPLKLTVIREIEALHALAPAWRKLANGARFRGPDWLLPWWHAYHRTLGAELHVYVGYGPNADGVDELVGLAPFYKRTTTAALLDVRELRMMGDAGPRPPALNMLSSTLWKERVGAALARALIEEGKEWDVIDLEPLADPSRTRATMVSRLAEAGYIIESSPSVGGSRRIALTGGGGVDPLPPEAVQHATTFTVATDAVGIRRGMSVLRRLSRLEWAERDEPSPIADGEAAQLLEDVALHEAGDPNLSGGRLVRLDDSLGEAVAAALVLDDRERAVVVAMAVDPKAAAGSAERMLHSVAIAAVARGLTSVEVSNAASDHPLPLLPTFKRGALSIRVWSRGASAQVTRTYRTVQRSAKRAVTTPAVAASQARAAWIKIRSAAAGVAQYDRHCLVRGQLWTRGIAPTPGLELAVFTLAEFHALDEAARMDLAEQLELKLDRATAQLTRGDIAVLARLHGRPAGIAWAARGEIEIPELDRHIDLSKYDAFIHDVFVASTARGRAVAPVMLEFLANELRAKDAYRSWALIAADNTASLRAFQKASYTPVCDVVYARMASMNRVIMRPPDPEAKELLGL